MKAKEIMTRRIISVRKDCTIRKLVRTLQDNNITGAPVVDDSGNLVGMVSVSRSKRFLPSLIRIST